MATTKISSTISASNIFTIDTVSQTNIPVSTKNLVGTPDEKASEDSIEIVFSFDTTGSMYSCLEQVQHSLKDIISRLFRDIPNLRIAVLAHGDYCDANMYYVMRWVDFTNDAEILTTFVDNVGQTGGGDSPECYELVLYNTCRAFSWSKSCKTRSLVLIGDANPHEIGENNPHSIDWREEVKNCSACGIKIYGIHCRGQHESKDFYEKIAEMSEGVYLKLENISSFPGMMVAICHRERDLITTIDADNHEQNEREKQQYQEYIDQLRDKTVAELKKMLSKNDQKFSGTKQELVERICDCKLYGLIPKCQLCKTGRLRVIYRNSKKWGHGGRGRYYCPGYYDDEEYVSCTWTGDETQVKRSNWID